MRTGLLAGVLVLGVAAPVAWHEGRPSWQQQRAGAATMLAAEGFEGGTSPFREEPQNENGDISVVGDDCRSGNRCLKIVKYGEQRDGKHRQEIHVAQFPSRGSDYWFGYSFKIDASQRATPWNSINQFMGLPDRQGNGWEPQAGGVPSRDFRMSHYVRATKYSSTPYQLEKGVWYDFVYHIRFESDRNGRFEVWSRRSTGGSWRQVADYSGVVGTGNERVQFRLGPYRPRFDSAADMTVYYDEVRAGADVDFAAVAPR